MVVVCVHNMLRALPTLDHLLPGKKPSTLKRKSPVAMYVQSPTSAPSPCKGAVVIKHATTNNNRGTASKQSVGWVKGSRGHAMQGL